MTLLSFEGLGIHLGGREILSPTSFEVARGEFVCIIGPSGCGKTTLLRAAAGFVQPSVGQIRRSGQLVQRPSREVAFVFQDYTRALLPWRTVEGNVMLALEAAKVPVAERAARVQRVLETVNLQTHIHKFPAQLSGGMQQRLQIARNLVTQPRLVFMDEPTAGLDVSVQARLLDLLRQLTRQMQLAVVIVTHDLAVARLLAHRMMVMQRGRVVEAGLTDQVLDDPQHPYTQLLVSSVLQP